MSARDLVAFFSTTFSRRRFRENVVKERCPEDVFWKSFLTNVVRKTFFGNRFLPTFSQKTFFRSRFTETLANDSE